jgi:2-polyprenyl-3-methyl-5-hydroxy-6-metoxy-1,4-benzoquinol methylase
MENHAAPPTSKFACLKACWICGSEGLRKVHQGIYEFSPYLEQDPELAAYTGQTFWLKRCLICGFAQPDALPTLPRYFDRMYDQQWSAEWIEHEFEASYKDLIFRDVLRSLGRRLAPERRRLLDVGAHVGRFIHLAQLSGWAAEGIELNPRTAAFAARKTGLPVHRLNAHALATRGRRYSAVTMLDVLEHIPDPVRLLGNIRELLEDDGWITVKVPCGPNQLLKETIRARLSKGYRVSVADNLVHINHFSTASLREALRRAGFGEISITVGAPELNTSERSMRARLSNAFRLGVFGAGRYLPGGLRTPLALNLQAYARKVTTKGESRGSSGRL